MPPGHLQHDSRDLRALDGRQDHSNNIHADFVALASTMITKRMFDPHGQSVAPGIAYSMLFGLTLVVAIFEPATKWYRRSYIWAFPILMCVIGVICVALDAAELYRSSEGILVAFEVLMLLCLTAIAADCAVASATVAGLSRQRSAMLGVSAVAYLLALGYGALYSAFFSPAAMESSSARPTSYSRYLRPDPTPKAVQFMRGITIARTILALLVIVLSLCFWVWGLVLKTMWSRHKWLTPTLVAFVFIWWFYILGRTVTCINKPLIGPSGSVIYGDWYYGQAWGYSIFTEYITQWTWGWIPPYLFLAFLITFWKPNPIGHTAEDYIYRPPPQGSAAQDSDKSAAVDEYLQQQTPVVSYDGWTRPGHQPREQPLLGMQEYRA